MKNDEIKKLANKLRDALEKNPAVLFAYLHGSILSSNYPRDVDIAVYLTSEAYDALTANAELSFNFAIPLELELERCLKKKVDVQVINRAPLAFRHRVIKDGKLIVDNNSNKRCDFEYLTRVEYFDFSPRYHEYLQEVIA
jgi:predicted nucleotidyltransferase